MLKVRKDLGLMLAVSALVFCFGSFIQDVRQEALRYPLHLKVKTIDLTSWDSKEFVYADAGVNPSTKEIKFKMLNRVFSWSTYVLTMRNGTVYSEAITTFPTRWGAASVRSQGAAEPWAKDIYRQVFPFANFQKGGCGSTLSV